MLCMHFSLQKNGRALAVAERLQGILGEGRQGIGGNDRGMCELRRGTGGSLYAKARWTQCSEVGEWVVVDG